VCQSCCESFRQYELYLSSLNEHDIDRTVAYSNSAGQSFETAIEDILLHVALHGSHHRGQVNLLLRQSGSETAAVDYIGFIRGVDAATRVV
jgi:uncharacterized damage-inducible protein DinB